MHCNRKGAEFVDRGLCLTPCVALNVLLVSMRPLAAAFPRTVFEAKSATIVLITTAPFGPPEKNKRLTKTHERWAN
jgi:hypothetical protein